MLKKTPTRYPDVFPVPFRDHYTGYAGAYGRPEKSTKIMLSLQLTARSEKPFIKFNFGEIQQYQDESV